MGGPGFPPENEKIGEGVGSRLDHIVRKGGKSVWVETKLTIRTVGDRTINQIKNAFAKAKAGERVVLNVAREPTVKEKANLRKLLGDSLFEKLKIVSGQTELFDFVKSALE